MEGYSTDPTSPRGGMSPERFGPFLDFRDPWGNRVEIVGYDNIQFAKAPNVLRGMGLMHLPRTKKRKRNWPRRTWRWSRPDVKQAFN